MASLGGSAPGVVDGILSDGSRDKIASRGWERDREWSRECSGERESRRWVANVSREGGCEWESRKGVTNVGRKCESRMWVVNVGREMGSRKKKYWGVCKGDPEGSNYLIKK